MKIEVRTLAAGTAGEIELDDAVFGLEPRADILHRVVRWQRAKAQAGTHSVLGKSDVSYSTKKIYKQKGTGNARAGTVRTNLRKGGGVAFAKVRGREAFRTSLTKKMRRLANRNALLAKLVDGEVKCFDQLSFTAPRTKEFAAVLGAVGIDRTCLVALAKENLNGFRSARNLEGVNCSRIDQLNAFDLLNHRFLVTDRSSLESFLSGACFAGSTASAEDAR